MLLVLSTFVGALIVPPLEGVLPQTTELAHGSVMTLEIASGIIAIAGILIAAWLWLGKRTLVTSIANSARPLLRYGGSMHGASTGYTTRCS